MAPLIQIEGLSKQFSAKRVFDDVSLSIQAGERVGFWGENGCGKTTLIRMVAGIENVEDGMGSIIPSPDCSIAYLPQNVGALLLPWKRAWQNLAIHGRSGMTKEEQVSVLKTYGFDHVKCRSAPTDYPKALSGGAAQRLAWACVLEADRRLLLLDEPFSHQDADWTDQLSQRLISATERGRAAIMVTHDLNALIDCSTVIYKFGRCKSSEHFHVTETRALGKPTDRSTKERNEIVDWLLAKGVCGSPGHNL